MRATKPPSGAGSHPREEGEDWSPQIIGIAQSVLTDFKKARTTKPGPAYLGASYVYGYLGRASEQIDELEAGIDRAPNHFPLHTRYLQVRGERVGALVPPVAVLLQRLDHHPVEVALQRLLQHAHRHAQLLRDRR